MPYLRVIPRGITVFKSDVFTEFLKTWKDVFPWKMLSEQTSRIHSDVCTFTLLLKYLCIRIKSLKENTSKS